MAIDENTKAALREMGLNAYEVDAYVVLLDCGQMTAMEISREAKVPYSKIYEVLNSLKEKRLDKKQRDPSLQVLPCFANGSHGLHEAAARRQVPRLGADSCGDTTASLRETRTRRTPRHPDSPWTTSHCRKNG